MYHRVMSVRRCRIERPFVSLSDLSRVASRDDRLNLDPSNPSFPPSDRCFHAWMRGVADAAFSRTRKYSQAPFTLEIKFEINFEIYAN